MYQHNPFMTLLDFNFFLNTFVSSVPVTPLSWHWAGKLQKILEPHLKAFKMVPGWSFLKPAGVSEAWGQPAVCLPYLNLCMKPRESTAPSRSQMTPPSLCPSTAALPCCKSILLGYSERRALMNEGSRGAPQGGTESRQDGLRWGKNKWTEEWRKWQIKKHDERDGNRQEWWTRVKGGREGVQKGD